MCRTVLLGEQRIDGVVFAWERLLDPTDARLEPGDAVENRGGWWSQTPDFGEGPVPHPAEPVEGPLGPGVRLGGRGGQDRGRRQFADRVGAPQEAGAARGRAASRSYVQASELPESRRNVNAARRGIAAAWRCSRPSRESA